MDVWNGERLVPWKRGYRNLFDACKPDGHWKRVCVKRPHNDEYIYKYPDPCKRHVNY